MTFPITCERAATTINGEGVGRGVALITGCSTGIGRATAITLASAGYRVVATARQAATLDALDHTVALHLDVTDASSIKAVVESVLERCGRIDVLVNNAGYALRGAVEEVDVEAVRGMFDTNVLGIIRMVHAVAPIMRRQGSGRIVNVGSLAGKFGGPANGSYAATKHAVEALSDAMRWELAPLGIRVILIEPGAIRTDFEKTVERNSGGVIARRDSPYAPLYAKVAAANEAIRATQPGPEAVASTIVMALEAEHPHGRYPVGIPWPARIAMAAPDLAKDRVVRRLYGLDTLARPAATRGQGALDERATPVLVPAPEQPERAGAPAQVAAGVWRLPVYGTNVYFVRSEDGWVLVDAAWGWGGCGRVIRRAAEALFGPDASPTAILLTHLHPDHDGAALELARAWRCPVYLHAGELPLARAVAAGDLVGIERNGNGLDRAVIVPLMRVLARRRTEATPARTSLADRARVLESSAVPGLPDWAWVHTPGHAPGHVAFFRPRDRVLLTGDAVLTVDASSLSGCLAWAFGTHRPHACAPPGYTNWRQDAADGSLAVLAALEPRVLASGHGAPLVGDAATRELRALAERAAGRHRSAAV